MSSFERRQERYTDKSPGHGPRGDCWLWTGSLNSRGYGRLNDRGRTVLAHRLAYNQAHGVVLQTAELACHTCDNPRCVRPDHLFVGSHRDNTDDMIAKGRMPSRKGEGNGTHKLTETDVLAIRRDGRSATEIAAEYAVHESTIRHVLVRRNWTHV